PQRGAGGIIRRVGTVESLTDERRMLSQHLFKHPRSLAPWVLGVSLAACAPSADPRFNNDAAGTGGSLDDRGGRGGSSAAGTGGSRGLGGTAGAVHAGGAGGGIRDAGAGHTGAGGSVDARVDAAPDGIPRPYSARFDWNGIVGNGQSLSVGSRGTPVQTTRQPFHNL